jgi:hypothetical protein
LTYAKLFPAKYIIYYQGKIMALTRPKYSQIYDTDYKQSVRLATTTDVGNLLLTSTITNTVDSTTVNVNDRILVKNQTDGKQNGIYRVVTVGTGSNGTWVRDHDADASDKVTSGLTTTISAGPVNAYSTWKLATADPITLGTTSLTFTNPFLSAAAVGGSDTMVQFNDTGVVNGVAGLIYNKTPGILTTGNITATGNLNVSGPISSSGQIRANSGIASTSTTTGSMTVIGGLGVTGNINATSKSFVISHPTKDGMQLRYGSLEGPEFGVYVRGKLIDSNVIELPDYWIGLVHYDSITVNLTPIGQFQQLTVTKIEDNKVYINGLQINCFYTVFGERKDIDQLLVEF